MVTRKYSLNSNAEGNFAKTNTTTASLKSLYVLFWRNRHRPSTFLTCLVSCQTQSTNWIKTGERSASVWFLSPCPIRLEKFQIWGQSVKELDASHVTESFGNERFAYQLEAVTKAQPFFLQQHLKSTNGAVIPVQHEHGQGGELARPVPAIAAVHHHRGLPRLHLVCDPQRSCQDQLQRKKGKNKKKKNIIKT